MNCFLENNYHTHTWRCMHATGSEREYIEAAIQIGIKKIGFSDHIPCPFSDSYVSTIRMTMEQVDEYAACIRRLQEEYCGQIEILLGFEAEYIPEFYEAQMQMVKRIGCDYMIMGQHFLESENKGPYMGSATDDDTIIRTYVDSIIQGMQTGNYLYLAHPDLMNYQGMDSVYEWEMSRLCTAMKKLHIPLEINILGMAVGKSYPKERFWKIAGEIGNDVILGIDAHCVENMLDVDSYAKCMQIAEKYNLNLINDI